MDEYGKQLVLGRKQLQSGTSLVIGPHVLPIIAANSDFPQIRTFLLRIRTQLKSPDLYTIGWIAALPIERAAATALLHDRHDAPYGFNQHRSDANSYTWGRIGEHNVIIASLPAGVYGTTSTATTASNLIHSLPHIRIGLLVGIGGGIARPDQGQDIRLGDIVVSQPDGTTGGVVQYDLGKAKAEGGWERKGSLDKPPPVPDLLQAMLEANPGMTRPKRDFTYQGAENDRLFDSKHNHVGGSNCDKCDSTWEVKRDQRDSPDPEIHYGIIASGNKLIKDAATRDSILEDTGHQCLCVEMEAAGLMDRFPCLVIRGVCDYADSHKNDRWQRYAAATAAAFAVELLEYVPAVQLEATQKVVEAIQTLELKVNSLSAPIQNVDYRMSFNQLPVAKDASFNSKAEEHNPTCLLDTREELLKEIDCWIDDPTSKTIFWLNGMAGTGKSTISRTVAHSRSKRGDLGASFFFKRGEMDRGNLNKLMSTLAYQLAFSIPEAAFFVKKILDDNPAIAGKPAREQFQKLIQEPLSEATALAKVLSPVVIVIDALDECDQEADIRLLINIFSQAKVPRPQFRIFLTSRPELPIRLGFSDIQGSYQDLVLHSIPSQIVEHDIIVFLNDEFEKIRCDFNITVGGERKLPPDWPGHPTVQSRADGCTALHLGSDCLSVCMQRSAVGAEQLEEHIPPELQYACMYWVHHQTKDKLEPDAISDIYDFLKTHFLLWLEVLILLGRISESIGLIGKLQSIVAAEEDWDWNAVLQTLEGHTNTVNSVVFSPDGRRIASGSDDKTVKIWDMATGEEQTLKGHISMVSSVVFSLDGRHIASGSSDYTIKIWDVATGEEEQTLKGHMSIVSSVVFSPDGRRIASGSWDNTIKIWDIATGEVEQTLKSHTDTVNSVVFSSDGRRIASGSDDNTVKIWDMATCDEELTLKGHMSTVNSVVFSPDGRRIASGSSDNTIKIWDIATGSIVESFDVRLYPDVLSFTDDGSVLVTSTGRFSLGSWEASTSHSSESDSELGNADITVKVDGKLGFGIGHDDTWITAGGPNGREVLWLPPDFRPRASRCLKERSGSVVVIGCLSGRVVIMGFRDSL
ncbi:Vegetative incompatibility protein HET-E-1 [Fusarium oxysporum f. sp. rapae]|uniref:Vegetative incompatibility protein HET-E-1 n=1 Tax=Fusarium oxysporum f. sp. rapae TaxID=485398 RepID=A0A8J5P3Q0_FUSOX|nr:Vegetative incompatibility protein HET-E-1 [Fusarium oxysporum f. sp. rapae]